MRHFWKFWIFQAILCALAWNRTLVPDFEQALQWEEHPSFPRATWSALSSCYKFWKTAVRCHECNCLVCLIKPCCTGHQLSPWMPQWKAVGKPPFKWRCHKIRCYSVHKPQSFVTIISLRTCLMRGVRNNRNAIVSCVRMILYGLPSFMRLEQSEAVKIDVCM